MGMVQNFFRTSLLPKQLNHSLIFLIPKQENRTFITYFRPVSLCNIAYKVIAKIMADRLRKVLGMLIKFPQATFVMGQIDSREYNHRTTDLPRYEIEARKEGISCH